MFLGPLDGIQSLIDILILPSLSLSHVTSRCTRKTIECMQLSTMNVYTYAPLRTAQGSKPTTHWESGPIRIW